MAEQLELDEHRAFQEKYWTVQRWAWVGYGLIIVAALLGFSGEGGMFARAQIQAAGNEIDYPRFARWQTEDTISIAFASTGEADRRILLSPDFGRSIAIEGAQPRPSKSSATAAGEELIVHVRPGDRAMAKIRIKPDAPGIVRGTVSIDGAPAAVTLIILP
ncbi:hypothetical protein [Bosea sp. PAMC 26642]|uniref:hypothetical protein n=1 Tax=Bosea sp. (strain PAMC 26642) TaxID=1792307 RepID=UPI0012E986DC|nr:hypothetical protein [Bosea sp. PAMC 26642]